MNRTLGEGLKRWSDDDEDMWTYRDPNDKGDPAVVMILIRDCDLTFLSNADMMYINLELNPEHDTGYGGYNSTRIWAAIYKENCFHSDGAAPYPWLLGY